MLNLISDLFLETNSYYYTGLFVLFGTVTVYASYQFYKARQLKTSEANKKTENTNNKNEEQDNEELKENEEPEKNFFDAQFEKEKLIEEKISCFDSDNIRRPLCKKNIEMSPVEKKVETECQKTQLDYIFKLLREQENHPEEQQAPKCPFQEMFEMRKAFGSNNENDYQFSVLKEDGTYEEKDQKELENNFHSQMKLYGL